MGVSPGQEKSSGRNKEVTVRRGSTVLQETSRERGRILTSDGVKSHIDHAEGYQSIPAVTSQRLCGAPTYVCYLEREKKKMPSLYFI